MTNAYARLFAEGWLEGRHGSGTYVADVNAAAVPLAGRGATSPPRIASPDRRDRETRSPASRSDDALCHRAAGRGPRGGPGRSPPRDSSICSPASPGPRGSIPLPGGVPGGRRARTCRPGGRTRTGSPSCARRSPPTCAGPAASRSPLSRSWSPRACRAALPCSPDALLDAGRRGRHRGARLPDRPRGAAPGRRRVVPCRVDAHGIVPEELPGDLSLLYTTPAHQYPLGGRLPVSRRQALIAWARATGALVVEDDYDSEFRYDVGPLPALHSMDPGRHRLPGHRVEGAGDRLRRGLARRPARAGRAARRAAAQDSASASPSRCSTPCSRCCARVTWSATSARCAWSTPAAAPPSSTD